MYVVNKQKTKQTKVQQAKKHTKKQRREGLKQTNTQRSKPTNKQTQLKNVIKILNSEIGSQNKTVPPLNIIPDLVSDFQEGCLERFTCRETLNK